MQNPLIVITFALCVFVLSSEGHKKKDHGEKMTWAEYKKKFNKSYETKELDDAHKAAFISTQKLVKEHNGKHSRGEKSFTLGVNHLSDSLPHEKKRHRGRAEVSPREKMAAAKQKLYVSVCKNYVPFTDVPIPAETDWRDYGLVTPVKDQGSCSTCYVFSAVGALEAQMVFQTGKLVSLSEQNVIDCMAPPGDNGCAHGGLEWDVFMFVKNNGGVMTEDSYPYTNTNSSTCKFDSTKVAGTDTGCYAIQPENEEHLLNAVATSGPVTVNVYSGSPYFENLGTGIVDDVQYCGDGTSHPIDHAILVVGYGTDNTTGVDYWIVKNSWGTSWGDQGYGKLARGKNCLSIAHSASFPSIF